jgi:hypothetical protein
VVERTAPLLSVQADSEPAIDPLSNQAMALGAFEPATTPTAQPQAGRRPPPVGTGEGGRSYRGLTPDQRRAARRQRLVDAGLASFGTVAFGATTIEQLCGDAGVTPRHFYEAFASREALLSAVYDDAIRLTHQAAEAAVAAAAPDPEIRTRAAIEPFVHAMCDDPRRARCCASRGSG